MTDPVSRRGFLKGAVAAGAAAALPAEAQPVPQPIAPAIAPPPAAPAVPVPAAVPERPPVPVHFFFTAPEAAFLRAAVDRLIPPDETWPGAAAAGVVEYIDRQLAGAYGNGANMYLQGPWEHGLPQQGYQLPYSPAELYRIALDGLVRLAASESGGKAFEQIEPAAQDDFLSRMEAGRLQPLDVPSAVFFETLLANTVEGFFADPVYGGNRDMAGWRMVGFPGAYGQYHYLIDNYGMTYDRPPLSLAEAVFRHGHDHH